MAKKRKQLLGKVEKVIKSKHHSQPEMAQIAIDGAEDLYREIRVDNELTDGDGVKVSLKQGEEIDVILEADADATAKKPPASDKTEGKG